jgi:hypothetical protein
MKKLLILSLGILMLASCKKTDGPDGPDPNGQATTFTVQGLEGADVKLLTADGQEFEATFDAGGKLSLAISAEEELVFTKLIAGGNEVLIGRKSGGDIAFKYDGGKVAFREPAGGFVPIDIVQELMLIDEVRSGDYLQQADLDLTGINWNAICRPPLNAEGFNDYSVYFKGNYDGGNHNIHNLTIDRPQDNYTALFGAIGEMNDKGGSVSNLTIASGSVTGFRYCASIVGRIAGGTVTNCANHAAVNSTEIGAGGVVGQLFSFSTMENCENHGKVTVARNEAGGVVHSAVASTIVNCRNYGEVEGPDGVGGIIITSNGTTIKECTNYGTVTASGSSVGGISAAFGSPDAIIENCVNEGTVRVGVSNGGGIAGIQADGKIIGCENKGIVEYTGDGQIQTGGIGGIVGSCTQGGEIEACTNNADSEIRNAYSRVGGIAGLLNESTVTQCTNNADIKVSRSVVGGIVGDNRGAVVYCYNYGDISGTNRVGGIVGDNYSDACQIRFCVNYGNVTSTAETESFVGGIVGTSYGTTSASVNEGRVVGASYTGGICGGLSSPACHIVACYNKGYVQGADKVGGVAGSVNNDGMITASYSVGTISGTSNVGGICGYFEDELSQVYDCYWANYDGKGVSAGHGTAYYFEDGTTPAAGVATGWPEATVQGWGIGDGTDKNWWKSLGTKGTTDYPKLFWEN